jgi:hypothetical protein
MGIFFADNGAALAEPEDVIPFLGKATHWKEGRSAYEAAKSWFDAQDIPPRVRAVLDTDPAFLRARLTRAVFEKRTKLDELGRASQTDVLAFLVGVSGPIVVGIEAKVDESFGPLVAEWNDGSPGKVARLAGLVERLALHPNHVSSLRYQLLHRMAATLIEATATGAKEAALVVQSFSPASIRAGLSDFQAFTEALSARLERPGMLTPPIERSGIRLRFGWVEDQVRGRKP